MSCTPDFNAAAYDDRALEIDLSDYYNGPADPAIEADMKIVRDASQSFSEQYKGRLASLSPEGLAEAYEWLDTIDALESKIGSYSHFLMAMDTQHKEYKALAAKVETFSTEIHNLQVFFPLELGAVDESALHQSIEASPRLARYAPIIKRLIQRKSHQLSEAEEKIMSVTAINGSTAWSNYFEQLFGQTKFSFNGEEISQTKILNYLGSPDRAKRQQAFEGFTDGLKRIAFHTTYITNTLARDKEQRDKLRHYADVASARNMGNNVEDEVVDALNKSVTSNYSRLSHRYYALKANYIGLDALEPWDRNAPVAHDTETIGWAQAQKIVTDSYTSFSPLMGAIASAFFKNAWIDATDRDNKRMGAFAMGGSVLLHPLQFINWENKRRDLFTLAHEMGHNVHQVLAGGPDVVRRVLATVIKDETEIAALMAALPGGVKSSQMLSKTPLTLAETASVFGEKLVFEQQLAVETDPSKRVAMLFGKLDDMMNTVVRQIAFYNFELGVHSGVRAKGGPLETGNLNAIYMQTQQDALGPAVKIDERSALMWSYVPHFIRSPFYVYAYAFGDCLVNALYKNYEEAEKPDFVNKYTALLAAGGTKHHTEALAPFAIDLKDPAFWDKGMDVIASQIDRLEMAMMEERAWQIAEEFAAEDDAPPGPTLA